jgi:16S rRNA A1518/A1519 N6-dimethyltransferase RsmA/KsgA/DIM1 with predicted DNA glycosylase/AP lyase activity
LISIDPEEREIRTLFHLANLDRKHVLEIGPGTGCLTRRYADRAAHVTAVDPWVDGIERARQTTPATVAQRVEFHPTAFLDFAADHVRVRSCRNECLDARNRSIPLDLRR